MLSGKSTFFCVFSKVPEFLLVAFKLLEIHWAAFLFAVLQCTLRFREQTYAKTQEVCLTCNASLLSLLRQTKGLFCFSFNKRSQKHAAAKTAKRPPVAMSEGKRLFCKDMFSREHIFDELMSLVPYPP